MLLFHLSLRSTRRSPIATIETGIAIQHARVKKTGATALLHESTGNG